MQSTQKLPKKETLGIRSRLLVNVSEKGLEFICFSDDPTAQTAAIKKCAFVPWMQAKINNAIICNKLEEGFNLILTEIPMLQLELIDKEKVLEKGKDARQFSFSVGSKNLARYFDEVTFCFSSKWVKEQKLESRKIEASTLRNSIISKIKQGKVLATVTKSLVRELNTDALEETDHDSDDYTLIEAQSVYRLDDSPEEYSTPPYRKHFHQLTLDITLIKIERLLAEALRHFIKRRLKSNAVFFTSERTRISHLLPDGDAVLLEMGDKTMFVHTKAELQDWTDSAIGENEILQCLASDFEMWRPDLDEIDRKFIPLKGERNSFANEMTGEIDIADVFKQHEIGKNKNAKEIWDKLSQEKWGPFVEKLCKQINPTTTVVLIGESPLALSSLADAFKWKGFSVKIAWPTVVVPRTTNRPTIRGMFRGAEIYHTQNQARFPASSLSLRRTRKSAKVAAILLFNLAVFYITKKQTSINA